MHYVCVCVRRLVYSMHAPPSKSPSRPTASPPLASTASLSTPSFRGEEFVPLYTHYLHVQFTLPQFFLTRANPPG